MGVANSKAERCEALRLCKERKKFIRQAIDSRYNLAAAHVAYVQSLRNIGIALRRFAEAELFLEPTSTEADKSPSSSLPPPGSGGDGGGHSDSTFLNGSLHSPHALNLSYMRSGGTSAVTHSLNPSKISNSNRVYVDEVESLSFTMPPPPPPPPESGLSWDYFGPTDDTESFRFVGHDGFEVNFSDKSVHKHFSGKDADLGGGFVTPPESMKKGQNGFANDEDLVASHSLAIVSEAGNVENLQRGSGSVQLEQSFPEKDGEREDPSEFISHRAKDFLSSIKDIENDFLRASKSGMEVLRMLEANKIRVSYSEAKEPSHAKKVLIWKRSTSSHSSSSANPLTTASKDENDDTISDFVDEFCMIAGSHSSTLERLYAWERKLYDEVKASGSIRKEYDRKCDQLRHQFTKDLKAHVIDKTRAVVKDLHSRIIVALHTVDSISKRIEKIRDEELQPQLLELIQGLMRMWKAMLECHHTQYITISLAYHSKKSTNATHTHEVTTELRHEIECFSLSFTDMVRCHTSYVESINGWLQNCITQPRERVKGRRAFSPRRALAPPIFVICRDWLAGLQTLPSEQLDDAIDMFLSDLHHHLSEKQAFSTENEGEETKNNDNDVSSWNLGTMHSSLTKVLDCLTKFSEASLKIYEDIKQKSETARNAYMNYRPPPRAFSI